MPIGEVFVAAFVTVLLERLASRTLLKFLRPTGIDARLEKWHRTLLIIKAVLTDAENKQSKNEAVKKWLEDLEDLAYDLDDIVDDLNTEALHRQLTENKASTSKVRHLIPTCCTNLSLAHFKFDRRITSKLNEISSQLEDLVNQISILSLVENVSGVTFRRPERSQMTSVEVKSEIRGRQKEKEDIVNTLLETDESNGCPFMVIPIVGMGGVGKTTLAQLVYNDDKLKGEFDIMAWACVSDEFDVLRITKIILEHVCSERCDYVDLNMLQVKLKQYLSNKKFLIVLDDVWNEKYGDWDILQRPFHAGKQGSKIIVTTRQPMVAKMMSRVRPYHLNELSDTDALSLLAYHAIESKDFDVRPDLTEISKSIVRRCKNLPLAVKAIGGILRMKASAEEWESVLNSEIWRSEDESEILPALKLSYHYLPPYLKRCFAYCAIYPKDYEFDKTELVCLWMAEGFLQQAKDGRSMEELGADYFDELLSISFFQKSASNVSRFVMHDFINDLAAFVSGYKCLRLEDMEKGNLGTINSGKPRHLSFISRMHESNDKFSSISSFQSLRTFLQLSDIYWPSNYLSQGVLREIFSKLYCVREISLTGYLIYELPDNIGDLRHLRYFNLSGNRELRCLPQSVSNLCNLEVLILEGCANLVKLPAHIENLISIRHLNIEKTYQLDEMPRGIARLTSLRTLSKMIVSKGNGLKISDLKDLSFLKGKISIWKLQNVENVQEAIDARLTSKSSLNEIRLIWSHEFNDSRKEVLELDVLEELKPHANLSSLKIEFYGGAKFSRWIENLSSFSKLTELSFKCCKRCTSLPNLGQLPLLRNLRIRGMDGVKVIGIEFYGNGELVFPSLESLTFVNMPEWGQWHGLAQSAIEFPKLDSLCIKRCPKLVKLPFLSCPSLKNLTFEDMPEWGEWNGITESASEFPHLVRLSIKGCPKLVKLPFLLRRSLEDLTIEDMPEWEEWHWLEQSAIEFPKLCNLYIAGCPKLVKLPFLLCPSLKFLTFKDMPECEEWNGLAQSAIEFPQLVRLSIESCPKLAKLPLLSFPSLQELSVGSCNQVILNRMRNIASLSILSLERIFGLISVVGAFEKFPLKLEKFQIVECGDLETMWASDNLVQELVNLRIVKIRKCPKLSSVQEIGVLPVLHTLSIEDCSSLGTKTMTLKDCSKSLGDLWIEKCPKWNLTNLMGSLQSYSNLTKLRIWLCDGLESFPQGGLPTPNLKSLYICFCQNLKALPDRIGQLSSLEHLSVRCCPSLMEPFPQGNLPPNLISIVIRRVEKLKPLGQWELQNLTSLEHFCLNGGFPELVSFAEDNDNDQRYLLPQSITQLILGDMPNLRNLKGFENLISLRRLCIDNFPKLVELPVEYQSDKLSLWIKDCPLLKNRRPKSR